MILRLLFPILLYINFNLNRRKNTSYIKLQILQENDIKTILHISNKKKEFQLTYFIKVPSFTLQFNREKLKLMVTFNYTNFLFSALFFRLEKSNKVAILRH